MPEPVPTTAPEPGPEPTKVVIVLAADLAPGTAANVAACLAAGLAAADPRWAGRPLVDAAGLRTVASSHVPITILRAGEDAMSALLRRIPDGPDAPGTAVSVFPAYAREMHDCAAYWARHAQTAHADGVTLGVGVQGPKRWVARLTGSLPLWR